MKKLLLLTKTLLAVALFCVGQNAWATDYAIAWQNLFDDAGTYQNGWSGVKSRGSATNTVAQGTRSGDQKYISFSNNAYNTVWTYTLSDISAISSASDYIFDMDFALTRCNASGRTIMTITNKSDAELFKVYAEGADPGKGSTALVNGSVYINGSASAEAETVTMNTFRGGAIQWYNVHITSNATDGTDLTLTNCADASETKTYHLSDGVVALGKIILDPANDNQTRYGGGCFDNFILKTPEDASSVSEPTFTITDFNGTSRTIELSTLTDGADIYYSETTDNPEETAEWTEYSEAFATTTSPIYAYAKKGAYSSTVATIVTGAGTAFALNTPTWTRTGANTYRITATATSALGVTATQTIHYTVNGGAEQTSASPADISDVDGDIVAWATADKFGNSANLNITYVKAYDLASEATWTYNLNSYPQAHSCTAIASALDTEHGKDMNGTEMYNLLEESYPNLFIENAGGWLLRNQASNAWKCQTAKTSIAFDNVTTSDVIYIYAINDNGSVNCINGVVNGELKYNYWLQHFYIVPTSDGAVNVTFNTGSSINDVAVYSQVVPVTITSAGYATYVNSDYDLDFSETSIEAYKVKVNTKGVATMTKVDNVPAGTPVLLYKEGGTTEDIPVMTGAAAVSDNDLVAGTGAAVATIDGDYTNMILNNIGGKIGFYFAAGNTVAANRAYLHIATSLAPDAVGGARMAMRFAGDNITAVDNVEAAAEAKAKEGKFIENGKLVIVKNGVKYNAAGAKLY